MAPLPPELVTANARVNAAYTQLPEDRRPRVEGPEWRKREDAIDQAHLAGDREATAAAVADWERFALAMFQGAAAR